MLFGDAASALIVSKEKSAPALEIVDVLLATNGQYVDDLGIRCPGTEFGTAYTHPATEHPADYAPRMNGQSVILQASRRMVSAWRALLERNHLRSKTSAGLCHTRPTRICWRKLRAAWAWLNPNAKSCRCLKIWGTRLLLQWESHWTRCGGRKRSNRMTIYCCPPLPPGLPGARRYAGAFEQARENDKQIKTTGNCYLFYLRRFSFRLLCDFNCSRIERTAGASEPLGASRE